MQDSSGQDSDYRLPPWKTASVSNTQPKYIRRAFSGNSSRIHRQVILFNENPANEDIKVGELNQSSEYNNQFESEMEPSSEITAAYKLVENEPANCVPGESNQPPMYDLLPTEIDLEMDSDYELAAEFAPEKNELNTNIIRDLDQPPMYDELPASEVESEMDSDYKATVVFEPCGDEPGLEVESEMDEDIQNRIQALEVRVLQLESEIKRLEEINQKSKNRGIIPLNGTMIAPECSCGVCHVEPEE